MIYSSFLIKSNYCIKTNTISYIAIMAKHKFKQIKKHFDRIYA